MTSVIILVVLLAAAVAAMGFVGSRTNARLAKQFAELSETAFRPLAKRYTNIGGLVGYHFQYDGGPALGTIDGTMTFLPRHAILYLPFSLLAGRQDRLSVVMHPQTSPPGQGHIFDAHQHRRGWLSIDDEEGISRTAIERDGRKFLVFWYNPLVRDRLTDALGRIPDVTSLRHFGYHGSERTYILELEPHPKTLLDTLFFFARFVPEFAAQPL